ncbi:hypothetical protein PGT21_008950 [Puccinia graminis f. sp. tritici]|uniref:Uncharacterized protein n=1 Tax=Puccinia graminis f. sp. tritici TaxID=56615 RepID=A0A5B0LL22_PUCGR|nr:hypothetical protein PGT21_008950 [Puccinia graminis f. sp. tritici]
MKLPLGTLPDHDPFPLRSRTRPLHKLPRYMAKRPLLSIKIPSLIDRVGKDERTPEVSWFSPFTPDSPSSRSQSPSMSNELVKTADAQRDTADENAQQSRSNVMEEDEENRNTQPTISRLGSRWSRRFPHGCLQTMFQQVQRTPTRHKHLSTISVSPYSAIDLQRPRRSSPHHTLMNDHDGLSNSRRTSNPFDYLSLRRHSKIDSPTRHDKTPTQLGIRPVLPVASPAEMLTSIHTPKHLNAPWSSTTC